MALQTRIIHSRAALEIVLSPFIVGRPLEELALQAAQDFVRSLPVGELRQPVVALDILRGGRFYSMARAFNTAAKEELKEHEVRTASLRAKRFRDPETKEWDVKIWDEAGADLLQVRTLVSCARTQRCCRDPS